MKNLTKLLSFTAIITFLFACEKEDIDPSIEMKVSSELSIKNSVKNTKAMTYKNFTCLVELPDGVSGPQNKGSMCDISAVDGCNPRSGCAIMSPSMVSDFFSALEIDAWDNGSFEFQDNRDFINDHYDFYMYLYNNNLGHHPDDIIAINGF